MFENHSKIFGLQRLVGRKVCSMVKILIFPSSFMGMVLSVDRVTIFVISHPVRDLSHLRQKANKNLTFFFLGLPFLCPNSPTQKLSSNFISSKAADAQNLKMNGDWKFWRNYWNPSNVIHQTAMKSLKNNSVVLRRGRRRVLGDTPNCQKSAIITNHYSAGHSGKWSFSPQNSYHARCFNL